jgi:hypothetical protein
MFFAGLLRAAEVDTRLAVRFFDGHAALKIIFDGELQVSRHFLVEIAIERSFLKIGTQTEKPFPQMDH